MLKNVSLVLVTTVAIAQFAVLIQVAKIQSARMQSEHEQFLCVEDDRIVPQARTEPCRVVIWRLKETEE